VHEWFLVPVVNEHQLLGVFAFSPPDGTSPPFAFWFEPDAIGGLPYVFMGHDVAEAVRQVETHILDEPLLRRQPTIVAACGQAPGDTRENVPSAACSRFDFQVATNGLVRSLLGTDDPNALGVLAGFLGPDDTALFGGTLIICPASEVEQASAETFPETVSDTTMLSMFMGIVARVVESEVLEGLPCEPNGCSFSPDAPCGYDFSRACDAHDLCYCTCGRTKDQCDDWLCEDLHFTCRFYYYDAFLCHRLADIYCLAVKVAGQSFFCDAQAEAGCAPPPECR